MKRNKFIQNLPTLSIISVCFMLTACLDSDDDSGSLPTGNLTVAVTDSPIDDATAVWINFLGIKLYDSNGYQTEITFEEPINVDLLSLQGSNSEEILIEFPVTAKNYSLLTFNIDFNESYMVTNEGNIALQSSNLRNAGTILQDLLINDANARLPIMPFSVTEDATTHLTFDFDLRKSIYEDGVNNIYSFSPAIRSVITEEASHISGSIDQTTYSSCLADGAVYIYSGRNQSLKDIQGNSEDPFSTANIIDTGSGYTYEFGFMPAGNYTIAIACDAVNDTVDGEDEVNFYSSSERNIEVIQGENSTVDF